MLEEGFWIPDTNWSNVQAGYTQDFLLGKKLNPCAELKGGFEAAELIWCIRERLNLQLDLGGGKFHFRENGIKVRSDYGILWGGNAKCIIMEIQDTSIAVDGLGGGWDAMGPSSSGSKKKKWTSRFWQGGVAVTQKLGFLAPYVGWNFNQTIFKIGSSRFREQFRSGPIAGCTATSGAKLLVNFEYRGWFEQGLSLSAQVRF